METFKLYTRDGGFVVDVVVPIFNPPAEIINWGERFFVRRPNGKYYEGMLWPIIPQSQPPLDKPDPPF